MNIQLALTIEEQQELVACEQIITRGLQTFVDVGNSLLIIRDKRLYRAEYGTFEDYCLEKWGFQRRRANRLIAAAEVASNLGPLGPIPQSERQARPLTRLEPEQQQAAWAQVMAENPDGKITGAKVQEVVDRIAPKDEIVTCPTCSNLYDKTVFAHGCPYCFKTARGLHGWVDGLPEQMEQAAKPHVAYSSGNNEWYTPPEYIAAARATMERIDLDPASSDKANEIVQAGIYYTINDDGLTHDWQGRIWMNPPYSSDLISPFCTKLAKHVRQGDVSEACVLVNNATETGWFNALLDVASAACLVRGRVRFIDIDGNPTGAPLQGQVILYIGSYTADFEREFAEFGKVLYATHISTAAARQDT